MPRRGGGLFRCSPRESAGTERPNTTRSFSRGRSEDAGPTTILRARLVEVPATEMVIAKFVCSPKVGGWSLRWADRNSKWHQYDGFENRPHFRDLLREVEADPTGIFFG